MTTLAFILASVVTAASPVQTAADIVVIATPGIFPAARQVPDEELAVIRGGMLLPNGLDVTIGIDIQTRVDGVLELHTVYMSSGADAGLHVYRDGTGSTPPAAGTITAAAGSPESAPGIIVDRSPTGTTVWPVQQAPTPTVNINGSPASAWPAVSGETIVAVTPDGAPIDQENGRYSLVGSDGGFTSRYDGDTISIQHLVGQATGAIVLNTGNDRVIDTTTSVGVDLGNFPVEALTAALAMDTLALDTVGQR